MERLFCTFITKVKLNTDHIMTKVDFQGLYVEGNKKVMDKDDQYCLRTKTIVELFIQCFQSYPPANHDWVRYLKTGQKTENQTVHQRIEEETMNEKQLGYQAKWYTKTMDKYYSMNHTTTRKQLILGGIAKDMLSYHIILYLIYSICWCEEGITLLENCIYQLPERVWIDNYLAEIIIKPVNTIVQAIMSMRNLAFKSSSQSEETKDRELIKPHKSALIIRYTILYEYFKALLLMHKAPDCHLQTLSEIKNKLKNQSKLYAKMLAPLGDIEMMLFTLPAAFDDWAYRYHETFNNSNYEPITNDKKIFRC